MPPECTECLLAYICGFPCIMYYSFNQSFTSHSCLSNVYTLLSVCISLYSHQQKNPLCFIAHHYGFTCCVCVHTLTRASVWVCLCVYRYACTTAMWSVDSLCKLILSYLVEAESLDSAALHTPVSTSLFSKGVLGSQVYTTTLHGLCRFWIKIRSVGLRYKHFYLFSHFTSPFISLMIGVLLISSYTYWQYVFFSEISVQIIYPFLSQIIWDFYC